MIIYSLHPDYEYMTFILEDDSEESEVWDLFDGRALGSDYPPIAIIPDWDDRGLTAPDHSHLYHTGRCVFSERAVRVLDDLLATHGELLDAPCDVGTYYHFNVTRVVDALDLEHSIYDAMPRPKGEEGPIVVEELYRYWFNETALGGGDIFKLPQFVTTKIYVSDRFVDRVEQAGLTGFRFERLWSPGDPLPKRKKAKLPR